MKVKFYKDQAVFAGSSTEGFVRVDDEFSIISLRVNPDMASNDKFIGHHYPIEVVEEAVYHKREHGPGSIKACDCPFVFEFNDPVVIQDPNSGKALRVITVDVVSFAED